MTMNRRQLLLTTPALLSACAALPPTVPDGLAAGEQRAWTLEGERFWIWLPREYAQTSARWPLVVFLHGSGERGTDLQKVKVHGPPKLVAQGQAWPAILVRQRSVVSLSLTITTRLAVNIPVPDSWIPPLN